MFRWTIKDHQMDPLDSGASGTDQMGVPEMRRVKLADHQADAFVDHPATLARPLVVVPACDYGQRRISSGTICQPDSPQTPRQA